jgi:hypothetical protein
LPEPHFPAFALWSVAKIMSATNSVFSLGKKTFMVRGASAFGPQPRPIDDAESDGVRMSFHPGHSPCQKAVICQTSGTPASSMNGKVTPSEAVR